jgi:hypothetical protein
MNKYRKYLRILPLIGSSIFITHLALSQTPATSPAATDADSEITGVKTAPASNGPVVVNWHFKRDTGLANLTVNQDGTWLYSGHYKQRKSGKDLDVVLALKSSTGGVVLFQYVGDASNGVDWSEQGQSDILKDDFKTFAGKHDYYGEYHLHETSEGRAKLFAERERKKEELKKEIEEAVKRHDEKVAAEKKAEKEKMEKKEREEAEQAAQQNSGGGSSSSSVWSTVGSVAAAVGGALLSIF